MLASQSELQAMQKSSSARNQIRKYTVLVTKNCLRNFFWRSFTLFGKILFKSLLCHYAYLCCMLWYVFVWQLKVDIGIETEVIKRCNSCAFCFCFCIIPERKCNTRKKNCGQDDYGSAKFPILMRCNCWKRNTWNNGMQLRSKSDTTNCASRVLTCTRI